MADLPVVVKVTYLFEIASFKIRILFSKKKLGYKASQINQFCK